MGYRPPTPKISIPTKPPPIVQKAIDVGTKVTGTMIGGPVLGTEAAKAATIAAGRVFGQSWGQEPAPAEPAGPGPAMPRPELTPWASMNQQEIAGTQLYKPTTVTGAEIKSQMEQSPWYQMAQQKQAAEQAQLLNRAMGQTQGSLAGARSQLAMRGGLRGGSAERLAMAGQESLLGAAQGIRGAGAVERGQLGMQAADLSSRLAQLNAATLSEAQARNVQAGLGELNAKRAYDMAKYQEQMRGYGAEKTAQALGKEPKPGIFSDPLGYLQSKSGGY